MLKDCCYIFNADVVKLSLTITDSICSTESMYYVMVGCLSVLSIAANFRSISAADAGAQQQLCHRPVLALLL